MTDNKWTLNADGELEGNFLPAQVINIYPGNHNPAVFSEDLGSFQAVRILPWDENAMVR